MTTVGPVKSINDEITGAKNAGISKKTTDPFLENVSFIEKNPLVYTYASLVQQNVQLSRKIIERNTVNMTEDKKSFYQQQRNESLDYFLWYLFWLYYIVALLFAAFLYTKKIVDNIYLILGITIVLLLYPIWMIWLERGIMIAYRFVTSFIFGIPFALPRQLYVFEMPTGQKLKF